jgi:hypothetical protein
MFTQVVGTIFTMMADYDYRWQEVVGSRPTAILGFQSETAPKPLQVNIVRMIGHFQEGIARYEEILGRVLSPAVFGKLREVSDMTEDRIDFPQTLWVQIIYEYAVAYQEYPDRTTLLQSLIPLYFGYVSSFIRETETFADYQAEEVVESLCRVFEDTKPYLKELWEKRLSGWQP